MKKFSVFVFLIYTVFVFGQTQDAWVYFNDKPQATYYLDNPQEMLSQRALDRRITQNIPLDFSDVPIHQPFIDEIINTGLVQVLAQSKWMNAIHIRGTFDNISGLSGFTFIENIDFADKSLNTQQKLNTGYTPRVSQKILDTQESFAYGSSANQIQLHNGQLLHQQGFTGNGKIIAILDNGFIGVNSALPFQRLHSENLILGGYNFVNRNNNFYLGGNHGTKVLSTIGAYQENELIGTAPNAQFYLFITEDVANETPLEESLWVEAAEVADSLGVDIINTSLGYNTFDNPNYNYTYQDMNGTTTFISRGLNFAYAKGIVCVTSAGNEGSQNWQYITAPADAPGSFTIGATNNSGEYATFSSVGPTSDNRIKPDVVAQGVSAVTSDQFGELAGASGTSFSAPIITGLVACLWEAFPDLTNQQLMQLVRESAHLYNSPTAQLGYGIPDFYQAYQNGVLPTENIEIPSFKLHPNPVSDFLYFYTNSSEQTKFKLFDISGKNILVKTLSNNSSIDIQHLQNGMYIYYISSDNQIKTGKIIKQ